MYGLLDSYIQSEIYGLLLIRNSHSIRVPEVYCQGSFENRYFMVVEYLKFARDKRV